MATLLAGGAAGESGPHADSNADSGATKHSDTVAESDAGPESKSLSACDGSDTDVNVDDGAVDKHSPSWTQPIAIKDPDQVSLLVQTCPISAQETPSDLSMQHVVTDRSRNNHRLSYFSLLAITAMITTSGRQIG